MNGRARRKRGCCRQDEHRDGTRTANAAEVRKYQGIMERTFSSLLSKKPAEATRPPLTGEGGGCSLTDGLHPLASPTPSTTGVAAGGRYTWSERKPLPKLAQPGGSPVGRAPQARPRTAARGAAAPPASGWARLPRPREGGPSSPPPLEGISRGRGPAPGSLCPPPLTQRSPQPLGVAGVRPPPRPLLRSGCRRGWLSALRAGGGGSPQRRRVARLGPSARGARPGPADARLRARHR